MKQICKVIFFVLLCYKITEGRKLPSYVKICSRNSPNLEECFKDSVEQLKPYLTKGIPEMGIPPLDPLIIPSLYLETGKGSTIGYASNLTDMAFVGGKDLKIQKLKIDFDKGFIDVTIHVPHFEINGHYTAHGKILVLEFDSDGPFYGNLTDVTITAKWQVSKVTKKGKEHFKFDKSEVDVDVKQMQSEFKNLFRGNPELTDNTNRIINENSDVLYEEIKPVIGGGISQYATAVFSKVHDLFSNEQLYPTT